MPLTEQTNVSITDVQGLMNKTSIPDFTIAVNSTVYAGWMWFLLLCGAWAVMYINAQRKVDQPLNNMMYASAIVTVASLFFRVVYISMNGVAVGLLTDPQLWIFPIATALLAVAIFQSD